MSATGADHYETLGIERSASAADVKRAYFQLARVHTPEDAPERFQQISEAYRVLSDPEARKRYDAEERLPPEIASILERAAALCGTQPAEAAALAKTVLVAPGRTPASRFAAGVICMRARRPADALPVFQDLARENPENADFAVALGDACLGAERNDDAEAAFRASLALDGARVAAWLGLANSLDARGRPMDALHALDEGIAAAASTDMRSLPLRIRKLYVLARDPRWDAMDRVVVSICASVPKEDEAAARHAASQLAHLAEQFDKARVFDVAKFAIDAALQLAPHPGMEERSRRISAIAAAQREARIACKDEKVPPWILAMVTGNLGPKLSEKDWTALCNKIIGELASHFAQAERQWTNFLEKYPKAAEQTGELYGKLRDAAVRARAAGRGGAAKQQPSGARVAVLAVMMVVFVLRAIYAVTSAATTAPTANFDRSASTREFEKSWQDEAKRLNLNSLTPEQQKRALRIAKDALPRSGVRDAAPDPAKTGK